MFKSNRALWAVSLCFVLLGAAACGDDPAPAAPTPTPTPTPTPDPEPVTITGEWHGHVHGNLIDGEAHVNLMQDDNMMVSGDWHMEMMPQAVAALLTGTAAADEEFGGDVTGMVTGETAELHLTFKEIFHDALGHDCEVHVDVSSFAEDDLEATWETEGSDCVANDEGTLDMHNDADGDH